MGEDIIAGVRTLPVQLRDSMRSFPVGLRSPSSTRRQTEGCAGFHHQLQFIQLDD